MTLEINFDDISDAAGVIRDNINDPPPRFAVICGPGLEKFRECMEVQKEMSYSDIPKFPEPTVEGSIGKLLIGNIGSAYVFCLLGYVHYFEGLPPEVVAMPIRVLQMLRVELIILVTAATSLNPDYSIGDVMLVKDHINFLGLVGHTPLRGENDGRWGTRFQPTNKLYCNVLREQMKNVFSNIGSEGKIVEGVYACVGHPNFPTPAEVKFLRSIGADAVGSEIGNEVLAAKHCGVQAMGVVIIANKAEDECESESEPSEEAVLNQTKEKAPILMDLVKGFLSTFNPEGAGAPEAPAATKACGCPVNKK